MLAASTSEPPPDAWITSRTRPPESSSAVARALTGRGASETLRAMASHLMARDSTLLSTARRAQLNSRALAPLLSSAALTVAVGACGSAGTTSPTSSADKDAAVSRLSSPRFTNRPSEFATACRRLARTVGADLCPRTTPAGRLRIAISRPLHGWRDTYGIDLASTSLARAGGGRRLTAGGHWTIEATGQKSSQRLFDLQLHPHSASRPSHCGPATVAAARVTVCTIPDHEHGGGYYAGHVVVDWREGDLAVQISAHGYRNKNRVLGLMRSAVSGG